MASTWQDCLPAGVFWHDVWCVESYPCTVVQQCCFSLVARGRSPAGGVPLQLLFIVVTWCACQTKLTRLCRRQGADLRAQVGVQAAAGDVHAARHDWSRHRPCPFSRLPAGVLTNPCLEKFFSHLSHLTIGHWHWPRLLSRLPADVPGNRGQTTIQSQPLGVPLVASSIAQRRITQSAAACLRSSCVRCPSSSVVNQRLRTSCVQPLLVRPVMMQERTAAAESGQAPGLALQLKCCLAALCCIPDIW